MSPWRRAAAVAVVAAVGALAGAEAAAPARATSAEAPLLVFFTKGEQLATVRRDAPRATVAAAVRALVAGPSADEVARNFRTSVPTGTQLRSVRIAGGTATIDVSARFAAAGETASVRARLAQLVYTATAVGRVRAVRLLVEGRLVETIGDAPLVLHQPLTRAAFGRQPHGAPARRRASGPFDPAVRRYQARLALLGYLPRAG